MKPGHTCDYCSKSFTRESSFLVHMCEPKRRWLDRDTKHVKLGFITFQKFYASNQIGRTPPTYEKFMRNTLYLSFTSFGRYVLHINAINIPAFTEFLIKTGVHMNRWESPIVYETYVRELNKKETAEAAVERQFLLMQQWANDSGEEWTDFFRKVAPAQATGWIRSGRISPWVLFNCDSANEMIGRLSEEQFGIVFGYVDPDFWRIKFERNQDVADAVRDELKSIGM